MCVVVIDDPDRVLTFVGHTPEARARELVRGIDHRLPVARLKGEFIANVGHERAVSRSGPRA